MSASNGAAKPVAVVEDVRFREHRAPPGHPERPERLAAIAAAIAPRASELARLEPRPASPEEILRVHTREHLERLSQTAGHAGQLDPDTYFSAESYDVARLAAGSAIDLVRGVANGSLRSGLAAVRPPGHHAEADRAMGFCLLNNAAIAARAVQAEEGVDRVLILDWDVHHGNGTQHYFEPDPSVLYFSTHQYPYYPGTGDVVEAGSGKGEGFTVNVPLPAGCGDAEYVGALQRILVPVVQTFRPELLLVSCGFDAHVDDPLAAMGVTGEGFRRMTAILRALAEDVCGGRLALILEGGYAASGLEEGCRAVLDALLDPDPGPPPASEPLTPALADVVGRLTHVHEKRFSGIGSE